MFMDHSSLTIASLYDLTHTIARTYLEQFTYPWEALPDIGNAIDALGPQLAAEGYVSPHPGVWIHPTAIVAPTAFVGNRVIIGARTEVRHGAYIRGNALIGCDAVVGNSSELKNVILFDKVQVPHYNYVGDSILGYAAHLGAGAITSNVKGDKSLVDIVCGSDRLPTGLKKCGALVGDRAEVGCNSVLNPGTVLGRNCQVYPLSMVRGFVPAHSLYKHHGDIVPKR